MQHASVGACSRRCGNSDPYLIALHRQAFHLLIDHSAGACQLKVDPTAFCLDELVAVRVVGISVRSRKYAMYTRSRISRGSRNKRQMIVVVCIVDRCSSDVSLQVSMFIS